MDANASLALSQQGLWLLLVALSPLLLTALLVGLALGLLQATTQIQDSAISFAPKLAAVLSVLVLLLPWLAQCWLDYTRQLWLSIPRGF